MDIIERFNAKFGRLYESLFGGEAGELRPKDVLRKIIAAMEENRKEGFDSKVYVPNKFVLELAVDDPEERDYLLSFLDEEELVSVLERFMAQNSYYARGPLDFTISEIPAHERDGRREKLRVKVRFERGAPSAVTVSAAASPEPEAPKPPVDEPAVAPMNAVKVGKADDDARWGMLEISNGDARTVAAVDYEEEPGTVPAIAWASLSITSPDSRKSHFSLTKPIVTIGRSRNAGNDLVLDSDGMVSKVHARFEREGDGRWTIFDLNSTNGIKANGGRIEGNRALCDGDNLVIGGTAIVFHEGGATGSPAPPREQVRRARLVGADGEEHVLASETLLGRGPTSDIVLSFPNVSTRHARVIAPDASTYYVEDLGSATGTFLNDRILTPQQRTLLADGDILRLGGQTLRFVGSARQ